MEVKEITESTIGKVHYIKIKNFEFPYKNLTLCKNDSIIIQVSR